MRNALFRHLVQGRLDQVAVQVERGKSLHRGEAEEGACVFSLVQDPAKHQLIDVRDLVETGIDHGVCSRKSWHMAGYAHAEIVGFANDGIRPFGIHGIVQLHLRIAARGIPTHKIDGCLLVGCDFTRRCGEFGFALDKSRPADARSRDNTIVDPFDQPVQDFVLISHVTD